MNNPTAYTPLESLLLFQVLLSRGVGPTVFGQISDLLRNNALVKEDETYDPRRLSPDALRELFLHLLREELRTAADASDRNDGAPSSNSRKRKLQSPPLPTLKEAQEHVEKLPAFVETLYARYRDHTIRQIREDELKFDALRQEIQNLEASASEDKITRDTGNAPVKNGAPVLEQSRGAKLPNGPAPTPTPPVAKEPVRKGPTPVPIPIPPIPPPRRDVVPPSAPLLPPSAATQSPVPSTTASAKAHDSRPNGAGQVLQPPIGATQATTQRVQTPIQPPQIPHLPPRHDSTAKNKGSSAPQQAQSQGQPKWDKQYQPIAQGRPQPGTPLGHAGPVPHQPIQPPPGWYTPTQYGAQVPPHSQGSQSHAQPHPVLAQPPSAGQLVTPSHTGPGGSRGAGGPARGSGDAVSAQRIAPNQGAATPVVPPILHHATPLKPSPRFPLIRQIVATAKNQSPVQGAPQSMPTGASRPSSAQNDGQQPHGSPYKNKSLRSGIPGHLSQATGTPMTPGVRHAAPSSLPQTPVTTTSSYVVHGSGTKWTLEPSPSTPKAAAGEAPTPAFEPLSPIPKPATLPAPAPQRSSRKQTPKPVQEIEAAVGRSGRGRPPKSTQRGRVASGPTRRSQSVTSQTDELALDHLDLTPRVKEETATPRLQEETGDTTADESVPSRRQMVTPRNLSARLKRKRQETPVAPQLPVSSPAPPSQVLWTRAFPKASYSILDQIAGHRYANMFANPIRDRDAPGYKDIVLQPQDIKSIRVAITQGHKAAAQVAGNMPGGDNGGGMLWLPISEDLVPPKGIINSGQLEQELVHMFCNAIMYNLDPDRGPGPAFMKRKSDGGDEALGYQLDENAVVNNTNSMFIEVEKLMDDLRSAEKDFKAPPPSTAANTRPGSVAAGTGDDRSATADDDADELAADTDVGSTTKRRRISTRG